MFDQRVHVGSGDVRLVGEHDRERIGIHGSSDGGVERRGTARRPILVRNDRDGQRGHFGGPRADDQRDGFARRTEDPRRGAMNERLALHDDELLRPAEP